MGMWIIEPRDPLIVRDGRPFGPNPGARAVSLSFPFPSTTTGGVRTRAGLKDGVFDTSQIGAVKKIRVRGPLLIQIEAEGKEEVLVSAPNDALLLETTSPVKDQFLCKQLVPLRLMEGAQMDFGEEAGLMLVGQAHPKPDKPAKGAPAFWYWHTFERWLIDPLDEQTLTLSDLGHDGPQREQRIQISIDADKGVVREGALFATSGLEFTRPGADRRRISEARRLGLAVIVDESEAPGIPGIQEGLARLGGERRMASWRRSQQELPGFPQELKASIVTQKACRAILLTPACFVEGYRPTWLVEHRYGVQPKLEAIAVQRPQVVSGWDFELRRPKPSRRLAAAGTVFFLSLAGTPEAIGDWVQRMWLQCVSDDEQERNDGFGMAALGTWSGEAQAMQMEA